MPSSPIMLATISVVTSAKRKSRVSSLSDILHCHPSNAVLIMKSPYRLNRYGDNKQPYLTPNILLNDDEWFVSIFNVDEFESYTFLMMCTR